MGRSKPGKRASLGRAHVPHKEVVPLLAAWVRAGNDVTDVDEAVEHLRSAHAQYGRKQVRVVRQLVERAIKDPSLNPEAPEARLQARNACAPARMPSCKMQICYCRRILRVTALTAGHRGAASELT